MNDRVRLAPYQVQPPVQEAPSAGGVIASAFRLENDVINAIAYARRGTFAPDLNFDITPLAESSPWWNDNAEALAGAQSEVEFRSIETRLERENADRQLLAQAGFGGFAAGMAAGVLSPTILIPLVGGARGLRGVTQAWALAAGAATAAELPLIANQLSRTTEETALNIAAGTVLGGLLGSTAVWLRGRDRARLANDLMPDAPQVERAALIQEPDGTIRRVGDNVPLRLPPGTVRSPQAAVEMQALSRATQEINLAVRSDDIVGLRTLATTSRNQLTREIAQEVINRATPSGRLITMAEEAGISRDVVTAFRQAGQLADEAQQTAELARIAESLTPEQFARMRQAAQEIGDQPRRLSEVLEEVRAEREQPLLYSREEADAPLASTGAKVRDEDFTPMLRQVDPETGEETFIALVDPATRPDPGGLANSNKALRALGYINPQLRLIEQPLMPIKSEVARRAALKLSTSGLQYEGASVGVAPARGGTVEARVGFYYAQLGQALQYQIDAYRRYLGRSDSFLDRRVTGAQILLGRAPKGRLTFAEFKEEVINAMHQQGESTVKEASEVASYLNSNFFPRFNEAMLEATEGRGMKALYSIEEEPEEWYVNHIFSPAQIENNRTAFIDLVANYYQNISSDVAFRRWEKMVRRSREDEEFAGLLELDADGARLELDTINEALENIRTADVIDPSVTRIKELRDQRRVLRDEEIERLLEEQQAAGREVDEQQARATARLNVREQYDALSEEINLLEARLPAETRTALDDTRTLRRRRALIQRSFGRYTERQREFTSRIEANDERNLAALQRFEQQVLRLDNQLTRIDDARLDAELSRLEVQFDKLMRQLETGDKKIDRLQERFGPIGSENEPTERLSIEQARQAMRAQSAERTLERFGKASGYDREGARQAIRDRLKASREYVNRVNSKRAAANERTRQQIAELDPAQAGARAEELRLRAETRDEEFRAWLASAGADDFDLQAGTFDFTQTARNLATKLSFNITGNPLRISQLDLLPELKGPMKRRVLDIPYDEKKKFLELDSERLFGVYTRQMSSDIEVYRAFGSTSGNNMLEAVQTDLNRINEHLRTRKVDEAGKEIDETRRAREARAHENNGNEMLKDLQHQLDRIRGFAGMPKDPTSLWYRIGRTVMNYNVPIMMGSAMITSIPDLGRPVMAHGLMQTFGHAWMPLIRGLVSENQRLINSANIEQLKSMNIGFEMLTQMRAQASYDITANPYGATRIERGAEWLAQQTPNIALFGPWTDAMKVMNGMVTMPRVLSAIDEMAAGRMRSDDPELGYLVGMGITPDLAARIADQYNSSSGHDIVRGAKIPRIDRWTDYEALRAFSAALNQESDRVIITPGLEKPRWMDTNIAGRLIGQFRSFTMASHSKILISGLQSRDMALANFLSGTIFSLGMGTISYYIWANTAGERQRQEMLNASWETWLDQAIYRSGVLGALSEVQSIGSTIPATAPYVTFEGGALAGRRPTSTIGAVAGPSFGTAETVVSVFQGMDDPTQSTLAQARKLIPYQNVFFLRRGLNLVEEGAGDLMGLPESRR